MSEIELPPLPEHHRMFGCLSAYKQGAFSFDGLIAEVENFAREYARQAILMERERCAKVCETYGGPAKWGSENSDRYHIQDEWARTLAKAIRNG